MKFMNYLKKELLDFFRSFKLGSAFILLFLYELLFFGIMTPTMRLAGFIVEYYGGQLNSGLLVGGSILAANELELAALYSQLKWLVVATILTILMIIIVALLSWSLSRGLTYTTLLKKKFSFEYYKRFVGLNAVLSVVFIVLLVFVSFLLSSELSAFIYLAGLILLVIFYALLMIYIEFTKKQKVFASIGGGLSAGVKKFKYLVIPGILALAVGAFINWIALYIPQQPLFVSILLFIVYITWARMYFVRKAI